MKEEKALQVSVGFSTRLAIMACLSQSSRRALVGYVFLVTSRRMCGCHVPVRTLSSRWRRSVDVAGKRSWHC